ncbi:MAG: UMP kinase [Candidatus Coatesbacteria bacterium]|nr:UMP kinase [Candidatus Coatesbacteria bacterium]
MTVMFQTVLLKLSGEALLGDQEAGIDPHRLGWITDEIIDAKRLGIDLAIVVGGGNIYRGRSAEDYGIDRSCGDYMGMMATVINGLALQAALERKGQLTRVMTAIHMQEVAEPFIHRRAQTHLEKGRVVILCCGTGSPYFTTDTAGALRALELKADVFLKATNVDGVYTADPAVDVGAKRYEKLGYEDYLLSGLSVMDLTAVSLCRANKLPIIVFNLLEKGNLRRVLTGEKVGTLVGEPQDA